MGSEFSIDRTVEVLERTPATLRALLGGVSEFWSMQNYGRDTFSPGGPQRRIVTLHARASFISRPALEVRRRASLPDNRCGEPGPHDRAIFSSDVVVKKVPRFGRSQQIASPRVVTPTRDR